MLKVLRYQISKDTSAERTTFIRSFLKKRRVLGAILFTLDLPKLTYLRAAINILYGFSRLPRISPGNRDIAIWWSKNEQSCLASCLQGLEVKYLKYSFGIWGVVLGMQTLPPAKLVQLFRIAVRLNRKHPFVVTARSIEALCFYAYFGNLVKNNPQVRFYSSTQSQPYFSALNELSRKKRLKLCFVAHSPWVLGALPIHCDLGIFWGSAGAKQFFDCGSRIDQTVFFYPDFPLQQQRTKVQDRILISLSKNPRIDSLEKIIWNLEKIYPKSEIVIRVHPNSLFSLPQKFQQYVEEGSLREQLANSKWMIAGNSTVHLEGFLNEVPSYWAPDLDEGNDASLEIFSMIPFQKVESLWLKNSRAARSAYNPEVFDRIKREFFAEPRKIELLNALNQFRAQT